MQRALKLSLISIALVYGLASTVRAQAGESNATSGVITGRVSSVSGDLPISTTVYLSPSGATGPPRSALVNSDGTFKIEDLEIGVYRVWANAAGYVADAAPGTDTRGFVRTGESASLRLKKGGVITGTVISNNNAPVVAVTVRALRIRDEAGKSIETVSSFNERFTDDRGIYRIYGLIPGTYIVSAGGASRAFSGYGTTGFEQDIPTYAPSATRDTAMEVIVRSGEEATADIQYRGEPGHGISGNVSGVLQIANGSFGSASINITDVKSKTILTTTTSSAINEYAFAVYGLPDGEYELVAQNFSQTRDVRASEPKRIKVQGADVTGVNLNLAPLPAINGRVVLDTTSSAACVKHRETALQETIVFARREKQPAKSAEGNNSNEQVAIIFAEQLADAVADAKGEFTLRNLHAGTYRVSVNLPSSAWYLKSLTRAVNPRTSDSRIVSDGMTLTNQSVSGLNIVLSEGAATIRGALVTSEGKPLRDRQLIYLVPGEKDSSSNLLRYFETRSEPDGRFELRNIPPGDYLAVAAGLEENRPLGILVRQDANLRNKVIRDAQKLNQSITLKPCERVENFELPNQPAAKQ